MDDPGSGQSSVGVDLRPSAQYYAASLSRLETVGREPLTQTPSNAHRDRVCSYCHPQSLAKHGRAWNLLCARQMRDLASPQPPGTRAISGLVVGVDWQKVEQSLA